MDEHTVLEFCQRYHAFVPENGVLSMENRYDEQVLKDAEIIGIPAGSVMTEYGLHAFRPHHVIVVVRDDTERGRTYSCHLNQGTPGDPCLKQVSGVLA